MSKTNETSVALDESSEYIRGYFEGVRDAHQTISNEMNRLRDKFASKEKSEDRKAPPISGFTSHVEDAR